MQKAVTIIVFTFLCMISVCSAQNLIGMLCHYPETFETYLKRQTVILKPSDTVIQQATNRLFFLQHAALFSKKVQLDGKITMLEKALNYQLPAQELAFLERQQEVVRTQLKIIHEIAQNEFNNIDFDQNLVSLGLQQADNLQKHNYGVKKLTNSYLKRQKSIINLQFLESIAKRDYPRILLLLTQGADINSLVSRNKHYVTVTHPNLQSWIGITPLTQAALNQDTDLTLFLLNEGASADQQDLIGATALHIAAAQDNRELTQLLLNAKANPTLKTISLGGKPGKTPLDTALSTGASLELTQLLFNANQGYPSTSRKDFYLVYN
jgi:hypothetical protein